MEPIRTPRGQTVYAKLTSPVGMDLNSVGSPVGSPMVDPITFNSHKKSQSRKKRPTLFIDRFKDDLKRDEELENKFDLEIKQGDDEITIQYKNDAKRLLGELKESRRGCQEIALMWRKERNEMRELEEIISELQSEVEDAYSMNDDIIQVINRKYQTYKQINDQHDS
ncbi:ribosomal protein mS7 [Acrasis kona]|uniref:Ribosomal protein mS7 n=1 Tax=Acrasis kona TaxID=1008807 RepID=A0AAW2YLK8_9EUKA